MSDQATLAPDLSEAIDRVCRQYKGIAVRASEWLERKDEYLPLIPKPSADESWASGGRLLFRDPETRAILFSGDIVEYDPDSGAIFVDVAEWPDWHAAAKTYLEYVPFDFGSSLKGAFDALAQHPEALGQALAGVLGELAPPESTGGSGSLSFWELPWSVVWGPPGTGKTETVSAYLAKWASQAQSGKILVATPTNNAADEMALRLKKQLEGHGGFMRDGSCLVHRGGRAAGTRLKKEFPECLRDPAYAREHAEITQEIEALEERRVLAVSKGRFTESARIRKEINALQDRLPDRTEHAIGAGGARIVVMTTFKALTFAATGQLVGHFDKVVIDEAGMVSRAAAAAIATLGRSVTLAGDPKQIGPIFKSPLGLRKDVRRWLLFSALSHLESAQQAVIRRDVMFLKKQYRMHPDIRRVVSDYTYDGLLEDGVSESVVRDNPVAAELPKARAAWVAVDLFVKVAAERFAQRAHPGTGYLREATAEACRFYALHAAEAGLSALILSPYRAQVRAVLKKLTPAHQKKISAGTIHRQQGAERDVVVLDLVNGANRWRDAEIRMLVNVAMSRAKKHLIVIASEAEMRSPSLRPLTKLLSAAPPPGGLAALPERGLGLEPAPVDGQKTGLPRTLGEEIRELRRRKPLFSLEQARLVEKNIGEGHRIVRGVAGSGKSLILAYWAARLLQRNPQHTALVTYFNKGMKNLLSQMVASAARELEPQRHGDIIRRLTVTNYHDFIKDASRTFDAVFVDEAQDIGPGGLKALYEACRPTAGDLRNFVVFADDSQNIYGLQTMEELRGLLPGALDFRGRSDVLRETYRSTQTILSLAVNLALDPKDLYGRGASRLLEYMRVNELAKEGLIVRPEDSPDGLYSVCYTEKEGVPTRLFRSNSKNLALEQVGKEILRLVQEDGVEFGDIMVVTLKTPKRVAEALSAMGIRATDYSARAGNTGGMPGAYSDHVRCTTIFTSKGHESPISFFLWPEDLEDLSFMHDLPDKSEAALERIRRCLLYVAVSRAMTLQYVMGDGESRFMKAATEYRRGDFTQLPAWT